MSIIPCSGFLFVTEVKSFTKIVEINGILSLNMMSIPCLGQIFIRLRDLPKFESKALTIRKPIGVSPHRFTDIQGQNPLHKGFRGLSPD